MRRDPDNSDLSLATEKVEFISERVRLVLGKFEIEDTPAPFFSKSARDFMGELSAAILSGSLARSFPDLAALAFWCRPKNLNKIRENYPEADDRLGRGLCFHIAPGNIPINFAFSFMFSLLAGNANIVRMPGKTFPQNVALCELIASLLRDYPEIATRTAFVQYPRDNEINAYFSLKADARMIWGGDHTIKTMKETPSKPRCQDIFFSDRFSVALIDAKAILDTDEEGMKRLAENFYNDTWLMDQNACSSPQTIFWENYDREAVDKFWLAMENFASKKYELQAASAVDKLVLACMESVDEPIIEECERDNNLIYRMKMSALKPDISGLRGSCGYFHEYILKDRNELFPVLNEKTQTLCCYGVNREKLRKEVIERRVKGVDRIVPIGRAMEIGVLWDGHDLLRELSRLIALE